MKSLPIRFVIGLALCLTADPGHAQEPFEDATSSTGIEFHHVNGAFGEKWMPESLGSGVALFDADGDGLLDVLLVQSGALRSHEGPAEAAAADGATMELWRNLGDGTFANVTAEMGLNVPLYGFGAAPADFDGDGDIDVFVTAFGANRLFRNESGAGFVEIGEAAGLAHEGWGTSAAWLDYDRDGDLDLYLANYVRWSPEDDIWCSLDGSSKSYCTPESYVGEPSVLYRNEGDGRFVDVSAEARTFVPGGKSLGVTVLDVDDDGWPDFAVANDTEPNFLFRNRQDGTFEEIGLLSGMAFDSSGRARAGMGVDTADLNNNGGINLAVGNFSKEMIGLFELQPGGIFVDKAGRAGIGRSSFPFLTFGLFFFDYDLDGWLDMFAANGHLEDRIADVEASITYEQRPLLYRNTADGGLVDVGAGSSGPLGRPVVGRGAAYGDLDGDGDLDVVLTTNDGPAYVLRNTARDGETPPHVARLDLRTSTANTHALGALVTVRAGDWQQRQMVRSGSSYASQSEFVLTFGLGDREQIDAIEIRWPDGAEETLSGAALQDAVDAELRIEPTRGVVGRKALNGVPE